MQRQIHKYLQPRIRHNSPYRRSYRLLHTELGGGSCMPYSAKMYCSTCRKANKQKWSDRLDVCAVCKTPLVQICSRVRLPRKAASERVWQEFEKRFVRR
jgi:hypothetical protein